MIALWCPCHPKRVPALQRVDPQQVIDRARQVIEPMQAAKAATLFLHSAEWDRDRAYLTGN